MAKMSIVKMNRPICRTRGATCLVSAAVAQAWLRI